MGDSQSTHYSEFTQTSVGSACHPAVECKVNIFANVRCPIRNYFKYSSTISVSVTQDRKVPSLTNPNSKIVPDTLRHYLYIHNLIELALNFPCGAFGRVFIWALWSKDAMLYEVLVQVLVNLVFLTTCELNPSKARCSGAPKSCIK